MRVCAVSKDDRSHRLKPTEKRESFNEVVDNEQGRTGTFDVVLAYLLLNVDDRTTGNTHAVRPVMNSEITKERDRFIAVEAPHPFWRNAFAKKHKHNNIN